MKINNIEFNEDVTIKQAHDFIKKKSEHEEYFLISIKKPEVPGEISAEDIINELNSKENN